KINVRLSRDQAPDLLVGKKPAKLLLTITLDDKVAIEVFIAYGYVLDAEPFPYLCENTLAIDVKAKAIRVDVGSAHAGIDDYGFAGRDGIGVKRNSPGAMRGLDLVRPCKAPRGIIGAGLRAELLPDFFSAWTKYFS